MVNGIVLVIGIIIIIISRLFYCDWDSAKKGDICNNISFIIAVSADIIGTVFSVVTVLSYYGLI